jgi:hypothetical protein
MAFALIAAIDPTGPIAAACGITWTLMMPTSAVSAMVAAGLCPFRKTAKQAHRLSKVAVWSGALSFFAAVVGMVGTAGWSESTPTPASEIEKISDLLQSALLGAATGIPPLLGLFTAYVSRRKLTPKVQEFSNVLQSEGNKAPEQPA